MYFGNNVSYHNLGKKDGNRRIWLEGMALLRAGFVPGSFYEVSLDPNTLTVDMHLVEDNEENRKRYANKELRKVSRRQMSGWIKPIVDVCNASITALFGEHSRFRALSSPGLVSFGIHPDDLKKAQREARLIKHLKENRITKGDAFLGFGISRHSNTEGFLQEGVKTEQKWAIEMEARYLDVATLNDPEAYNGTTLFCGTVEEVEKTLLDPVDVFSFSIACTNHSAQGKAKKQIKTAEQADEVTSLFGVVSIIEATNPAILISENVPDAQNSATYELLRKELKRRGYLFKEYQLDQAQSGAIDMRKRYWMVAYSEGLAVDPDELVPMDTPRIHNTLGDIMEPADDSAWFDKAPLLKRDQLNKENGRNFSVYWVDENTENMRSILRNYTKHQTSQPHIEGAPSDKEGKRYYRRLSKSEHAKSKRIPSHLADHCSETVAHEGMGQSIVYFHGVNVARMMIRSVKHAMNAQMSMAFS